MKYLQTALSLVCAVLVVALIVMKRGDDARHESDAGAIADYSNQLWSAQTRIDIGNGTIAVFSNKLDESRSASSVFSNQLAEAQSAIALDTEQITNLDRQVAEMKSENQTLDQRVTDLTSQMAGQAAGFTNQITLAQTKLAQANKDYALLENRLRRDVAERVVAERKFNNPSELQAQIENLKWSPAHEVSAGRIYAGLDVEVTSNSVHVISPD